MVPNVTSTRARLRAGGRLDLLVENLGRINYGAEMVNDRKGIVEPGRLGAAELAGWAMYRLPLDAAPNARGSGRRAAPEEGQGVPTVYRGSFALARTGDTFLDVRGWGKGIVFVNGVNLGRYWDLGPQRTLYLPGAWLRRGRNEVTVFDLGGRPASPSVAGRTAPVFDPPPRR